MKTYIVKIYGRVQGVGFRYFIKSVSDNFRIRGTVKNNKDLSVSLSLQGEETYIDSLIEEIENGNGLSKVECVDIEVVQGNEEFRGFRIVY